MQSMNQGLGLVETYFVLCQGKDDGREHFLDTVGVAQGDGHGLGQIFAGIAMAVPLPRSTVGVVEVAVLLVALGGASAFVSVGKKMAAFVVHRQYPFVSRLMKINGLTF